MKMKLFGVVTGCVLAGWMVPAEDKPKAVELLLSLGAEEDAENAMALAKHEHDLHHLMKVRQSFPYPGKLTVSWHAPVA